MELHNFQRQFEQELMDSMPSATQIAKDGLNVDALNTQTQKFLTLAQQAVVQIFTEKRSPTYRLRIGP